MRITRVHVRESPPIRLFDASNLTDVVVLAGPNGVGKTRLLQALIQLFRKPSANSNIRIELDATTDSERESWGKESLDSSVEDDARQLLNMLRGSRIRSSWKSSVIRFESDRTIQRIEPFTFTWDFGDPWLEKFGWDGTFAGLQSRFQDTIHSIFRKVQGRRDRIGRAVENALRNGPVTVEPEEYPDPLKPFKVAFSQLLAPKELLDPEPRQQQLRYSLYNEEFPLDTLSSGEREVINIVFDFLLRNPEDCVVFFDEPELHLHPELSYKLLQTLRTVGVNNQFIFCTHSAEIITASLDQSVIFIAPPKDPPANQAVTVREDDETNQALRLLGHSIGIIALGKRLVLIEGTSASLDKQLYGALLKNRYPDLVLVPSGGKGVITSFTTLNRSILERTLWGVEFFMLCDRDAVPLSRPAEELEHESNGRLRILKRYHIENYFLDSSIIAKVFDQMEPNGSWLRSADAIDEKLREIARSLISYAVALAVAAEFRDRVGNLDIMPAAIHNRNEDDTIELVIRRVADERKRMTNALTESDVETRVRGLFHEFAKSVETIGPGWQSLFPGKPIVARFASQTRLDQARLKTMYIRVAQSLSASPFDEVVEIFDAFDSSIPRI